MTQIIDGFKVNVAKPIDSRIVTQGAASRNAIAYKYVGLRIYDTSDMQPYVWNGSAWVSENSSVVTITGTTTAGYVPKFSASSQITNSIILEENNGIKIMPGTGTQPTYKFQVAGTVKATQFEGSGNGITNISALNITGFIPTNRIQNAVPVPGQVQILVAGNTSAEWTVLSSLPAGALPSPSVSLDVSTAPSTELFPLFAAATGGTYRYYKTATGDSLKFVPRVGTTEGSQLLVPNGSEANPSVAFSTNVNTGFYRAAFNQIGISAAGKEKIRISDIGVLVKSNSNSDSVFKVLNSSGRPFIGLYGLNGDSKLSGTIGFSGITTGGPVSDFVIENLSGISSKTYPQVNKHFDPISPAATYAQRHAINMNAQGQTIISTNVGSKTVTYDTNGNPSTLDNISFPNGGYGCDIRNVNSSLGHGLIVRSGGGPNTVSARFDNGNKTIAYFTDRGLQIIGGSKESPSICFDSNINTGLYLETTNTIGVVAGGKKILTLSDKEIRLPKVSGLAYIFGDNTRIEGTSRTNSLEIYRPTTIGGFAICHFYSDIGGTKSAKAYIWPDGTYYRLSDARQKENIEGISYGLDAINKLRPVSHNWIGSTNSKKSLGFIAQEVEEVIDEVVNTSMDGDREIKALDYNGLVPVLIKALQELSQKVKQLQSK